MKDFTLEQTPHAKKILLEAVTEFLIGKDWHRLSPKELKLFDILKKQGYLDAPQGYVELTRSSPDTPATTCNVPKDGECCCICTYRVTIYKHPWNLTKFLKGNMQELLAFGCAVQFVEYLNKEPGTQKKIIISDRPHGMCELFDLIKELKT